MWLISRQLVRRSHTLNIQDPFNISSLLTEDEALIRETAQ